VNLNVAELMRRHLQLVELDKVLMTKARRAVAEERQRFLHRQRRPHHPLADAYRARTARRYVNFLTREVRLGRCNAKDLLPRRFEDVFGRVLSHCPTVENLTCGNTVTDFAPQTQKPFRFSTAYNLKPGQIPVAPQFEI
jgi:hypothetical protein